jgi:DNA-directed RNA polymerase subunit RPC12/RpoP
MSNLKFACQHCGQRLRCDERHAGRQIVCPRCGHLVVIPAASTASLAGAAGALPGDSRATIEPQMTILRGDLSKDDECD